MVQAALGESVCSGHVVGLVECAIDHMVICTLNKALSLILLLLLDMDFTDTFGFVEVSAVAIPGDMIEFTTPMACDGN
jgi:hypothetical protein